LGSGIFARKVSGHGYAIDQIIFAPFGDDPVLVSQVTITNTGAAEANLRWIEYWGCQVYQFSFRAFIELFAGKNLHETRRDFGTRFAHHFRSVANGSGLLESKEFLGRDPARRSNGFREWLRIWRRVRMYSNRAGPEASERGRF